jgi:hypothetical protein
MGSKKRRGKDKPGPTVHSPFSLLRQRRWLFALLLAAILVTTFIRARLRSMPLERDEGEYAYSGQLMLQGIPPYKLAYNMKLPGTYAAYAGVMAIFGQSPSGIRLGLILFNIATILFIFLLAERLFDPLAGAVAGASFALLSVSPLCLGIMAHATHFVVLPALAGLWLLLRAIDARDDRFVFLSGLLLGTAFLMKQPGIFFVVFGFAYLAWSQHRAGLALKNTLLRAAYLGAGAVLPFAITCLVLWLTGVFPSFWFWTFQYASQYASTIPLGLGLQILWSQMQVIPYSGIVFWALAAIGLSTPWWNSRARQRRFFLLVFSLFSFLAVCPGLYFREHYFILMLPGVALLAGVAVSCVVEALQRTKAFLLGAAATAIVLLVGFAYPLLQRGGFFFTMDPEQASRSLYWPNPFPEAVPIADYIRSHTSESDRIVVLGSEPEIYFYANRKSATGYIYTYGLMEQQKYAFRMQQEMIDEIEASNPEYLVYVNIPTSWLWQDGTPQKEQFIAWASRYVFGKYELVGLVNLLPQRSVYTWGPEAASQAGQQFTVQLFRHKQ